MSTKPFDIITEADARLLEPGTTVRLAKGGHVTPLAADTLRARRVQVVREDGTASADLDGLAPAAEIRTVVIGNDHTGIALKQALVAFLRGRGLAVTDTGTNEPASVDYPDVAAAVSRPVARGEADAGIVIDGAGLGSAIAANKIHGIRAAMCVTPTLARYSREHNGANVLALGSTLLTTDEALRIVETWLTTPMRETRYIRRLAKIRALERQSRA
jgi:ribose 5-phosphate isomerase B